MAEGGSAQYIHKLDMMMSVTSEHAFAVAHHDELLAGTFTAIAYGHKAS